jgi:amino acid transporter
VSLAVIGIASAALCFLSLDALIASLIIVQTLLQFVAQCVAVIVLRSRHPSRRSDLFRMPLFPLPALIALAGWVFISVTSNPRYLASAVLLAVAGVVFYLLQANRKQEWPFRHA